MVGPRPMVAVEPVADPAVIPPPRRPLDPHAPVRRWYGTVLGWAALLTPPGPVPCLRLGVRFDVLDVPAEAGLAALRHLAPGSPVAARDGRLRLLVAPGSAQEVPGVLDWLEWGALPLDLAALGAGAHMEAPLPPGQGLTGPAPEPGGTRPLPRGRPGAVQGAAVWLRPPSLGARSTPRCRRCRPWGRWGRPRSGAGAGHGGDTLPPAAAAARVRPAGRRSVAQPLAFS